MPRRRAAIVAALVLATGACKRAGGPTEPPELRAAPPGSALAPDAGPGAVDHALLGHVLREEYDQAYALMSARYRASVPLSRFRDAVSRNAYLRSARAVGCFRFSTLARLVHVRECILFTAAGGAHAMFYYERERVGWRMTGMLIGGAPALPGPGGEPEAPPQPALDPSRA